MSTNFNRPALPPVGQPVVGADKAQSYGLRDAFHVPAIVARVPLGAYPGMPVRFTSEEATEVVWAGYAPHGVVDPFLTGPVGPEQAAWIFLKPDSICRLRHHFDLTINVAPPGSGAAVMQAIAAFQEAHGVDAPASEEEPIEDVDDDDYSSDDLFCCPDMDSDDCCP